MGYTINTSSSTSTWTPAYFFTDSASTSTCTFKVSPLGYVTFPCLPQEHKITPDEFFMEILGI